MDKPKTTAKDFFLWAGAMVALYWSVFAYVGLVFDYINYAFPDTLGYYPSNPYDSGIGFEMASIIVLLPVFVILRKLIDKIIAADSTKSEIWVRRWALIATLFFAGLAFVVDLITLLASFFSGNEISTAFLLKVAVVALVAAGVFMHFIADLGGYWIQFPSRKRYVVIGVLVLAGATIGAGFYLLGTPWQARQARFDEARIENLSRIETLVLSYWQLQRTLPAELTQLKSVPDSAEVPVDPQTGLPYEYRVTSALSFELCATFSTKSLPQLDNRARSYPYYYGSVPSSWQEWEHAAGRACFTRTIEPGFYPDTRTTKTPLPYSIQDAI